MSKYDGGEITLTDQLKNFPTAEQLQNEFKNKIVEIINYLKKFSAYEVLAYFYSNYKFSYGEKDNKDDRWLQSKKIMYLQMLFSCIEENGIKEELQKNTLEKIEKYIPSRVKESGNVEDFIIQCVQDYIRRERIKQERNSR